MLLGVFLDRAGGEREERSLLAGACLPRLAGAAPAEGRVVIGDSRRKGAPGICHAASEAVEGRGPPVSEEQPPLAGSRKLGELL